MRCNLLSSRALAHLQKSTGFREMDGRWEFPSAPVEGWFGKLHEFARRVPNRQSAMLRGLCGGNTRPPLVTQCIEYICSPEVRKKVDVLSLVTQLLGTSLPYAWTDKLIEALDDIVTAAVNQNDVGGSIIRFTSLSNKAENLVRQRDRSSFMLLLVGIHLKLAIACGCQRFSNDVSQEKILLEFIEDVTQCCELALAHNESNHYCMAQIGAMKWSLI